MKDEEEEGHYDDEGNYVFNKNKDDIRDEWLDNLDWDAVKHKAGDQWNKMVYFLLLDLNKRFCLGRRRWKRRFEQS